MTGPSYTDEFARMHDPQIIADVTGRINSYNDKWSVPTYGPPVAMTRLNFYHQGEFVADFGLGSDFFTRRTDNFYSRSATKEQLRQFRVALQIENPYTK